MRNSVRPGNIGRIVLILLLSQMVAGSGVLMGTDTSGTLFYTIRFPDTATPTPGGGVKKVDFTWTMGTETLSLGTPTVVWTGAGGTPTADGSSDGLSFLPTAIWSWRTGLSPGY